MIYKTDDDNLQVTVDWYPVDGAQVIVSHWDGEDFVTRYDKRVIADNARETVATALVGAGFRWIYADMLCDEWGIEYPDDED